MAPGGLRRRALCSSLVRVLPWRTALVRQSRSAIKNSFRIQHLPSVAGGMFFAIRWLQPAPARPHSPFRGINTPQQENSMASPSDVFKTIKENEVKFVDLRFT